MIQIFSHKVGLVFRISNTMKNLHNHIVVHYHPIGWTQHPPCSKSLRAPMPLGFPGRAVRSPAFMRNEEGERMAE